MARNRGIALVGAFVLAISVIGSVPSFAAPGVVTYYAFPDGVDREDGPALDCTDEATRCSLDEVITGANSAHLPSGTNMTVLLGADASGDARYVTHDGWSLQTTFWNAALLTVASAPGAAAVLDGDGIANKVLRIDAHTVLIRDVTIRGARTTSGMGGGLVLANMGVATVLRSTFEGNVVVAGNAGPIGIARGGGISTHGSSGSPVSVVDSVFTGNNTLTAGTGSASGGAIAGTAPVFVTGSRFEHNITTGGSAGGSAMGGGIVGLSRAMVYESTFVGNNTIGDIPGGEPGTSAVGGGIVGAESGVVSRSTFAGNLTGGSAARGGGIQPGTGCCGSSPSLIDSSTFEGNITSGQSTEGGGILLGDDFRATVISRSTFVGNNTNGAGSGGAIGGPWLGSALISASTFARNETTGEYATGGAIRDGRPWGALEGAQVVGSIFVGNTTSCLSSNDLPVTDLGYNLSDDASCRFGDPAATPDADPGLSDGMEPAPGSAGNVAGLAVGVLGDHGGPTATALPVFPVGDDAFGMVPSGFQAFANLARRALPVPLCDPLSTDQRGAPRQAELDGWCTIGAVALESTPAPESELPPATVLQGFGLPGYLAQGYFGAQLPLHGADGVTLDAGTVLPHGISLTETGGLMGIPESATAGRYELAITYNGGPRDGESATFVLTVQRQLRDTPFITNMPYRPSVDSTGFSATISASGDGTRSVQTLTPLVCQVEPDGLTVTYQSAGACHLRAAVAQGTDRLAAIGALQTVMIATPTPETPAVPGSGDSGSGSGAGSPSDSGGAAGAAEDAPAEGPAGSAGTRVAAGGSASSSRLQIPTDDVPVIATVTSPAAGRIAFGDGALSGQAGYTMLGRSIEILAPPATAAQPLRLEFSVAAAGLEPAQLDDLTVFRDDVPIPRCATTNATVAAPDPCVASISSAAGIASVTVLSSHASQWSVGLPAAELEELRIAGSDRFETSALLAAQFGSADSLILANGSNSKNGADALAANVLAGRVHAPILLVDTDRVWPGQLQAIRTVLEGASSPTIYVMGGTDSVSDVVVSRARATAATVARGTVHIVRIAGADRYETAAAAATFGNAAAPLIQITPDDVARRTAIVASGLVNADALAAGPLSYGWGIPVLLADDRELSDAAVHAIQELGITQLLVLGGTGRVSARAVAATRTAGVVKVIRIAGRDRFATAVEIYSFAADSAIGPTGKHYGARDNKDGAAAYLANGVTGFADALSAGPLAGATEAPLLTVGALALPDSTRRFLADHAVAREGTSTLDDIRALGKQPTITAGVLAAALDAIGAR